MEILKEARLGHPKELHLFLNQYSPLAAANEDYSILLILRHFKVQFWKDERRVLNCHPIDEHYQWGITIATSSEDGGSQRNIYLPNELNYNSLKINDREIEIISDSEVKTTNLTEIQRKVDLFGKLTEENITASYKGLSNEYFEQKKAIAKAVKTKIIENKTLNCRPCSKIGHQKCPKGHFKCMNDIIFDFWLP